MTHQASYMLPDRFCGSLVVLMRSVVAGDDLPDLWLHKSSCSHKQFAGKTCAVEHAHDSREQGPLDQPTV